MKELHKLLMTTRPAPLRFQCERAYLLTVANRPEDAADALQDIIEQMNDALPNTPYLEVYYHNGWVGGMHCQINLLRNRAAWPL